MNKATLTALAILTIAGCSGGTREGNASDTPPQTDKPSPGEVALELVSRETGLSQSTLTVANIEAVQFSDSSLGCPRPDLAYLQVITPGHKVIVRTEAGEELDVRVAGTHGVICRQPPVPGKR